MEPSVASTWIMRGFILFGLFWLTIPGWVVGGYLVLKWTGLIRGMSRESEIASVWAITAFIVAFFGVLIVAGAMNGSGEDVSWMGPMLLAVPLAAAGGTFYLIRASGGRRRFVRNPDWRTFSVGVAIAVVGAGVSLGSYSAASKGGGTYVVAWGAVLVGAAMALRSLRRA